MLEPEPATLGTRGSSAIGLSHLGISNAVAADCRRLSIGEPRRSILSKYWEVQRARAVSSAGQYYLHVCPPMDYHHVHYPDDGTTLERRITSAAACGRCNGALQNQSDILLRNERQINILNTRTFGRLAFVEVGAMSVGRIVEIHPHTTPFQRGEEKSVFKFGGSAIAKRWRSRRPGLTNAQEPGLGWFQCSL
jgi:Phosphatidylserine decarboxylase